MASETRYDPTNAIHARRLALAGFTRADLARFFEVEPGTIDRWRLAYIEFDQAIRDGGAVADGIVAGALFKRAVGFSRDGVKVGFNKFGDPIYAPYTEVIDPDVTAALRWLERRPETRAKWKDVSKVEQVQMNPDGSPVPTVYKVIFQSAAQAAAEAHDAAQQPIQDAEIVDVDASPVADPAHPAPAFRVTFQAKPKHAVTDLF